MSTFITYDDFKEFIVEKYGKEVLIYGYHDYYINENSVFEWNQIGINQYEALTGMNLKLDFNDEKIPFNELLQVEKLTPIVEVRKNGKLINYNLLNVEDGILDIKIIGFKY